MSDQLPMFDQMTSEDTPSAISSQESESGLTPCVSPDGPTTGKSGPDHVPASHSARPEKAKRSTTKGIFGQSSFGSSKHEDLSFALASRLRPLTDSLGSTLFSLTWITRVTPAGRSICALRASEPRTGDSACIGWPTPDGQAFNVGADPEKHQERLDRLKEIHGNGNGAGTTLGLAASLAGWPTTRAEDAESSGMRHTRGVADTMTAVASLSSWATPTGRDWKSGETGGNPLEQNARPLSEQAVLTAWKTPCVPNGGRISGNPEDIGKHQDGTKAQISNETEARLTAFGDQPIGFLLGPNGWEIVPASGQLSAEHSRWLMGLPPVWDDCGVTAMASLRKSRRVSSEPTWT